MIIVLKSKFCHVKLKQMPYDEVCYQRLEDDNSNNQEELISLSMMSNPDGVFESNNNINST